MKRASVLFALLAACGGEAKSPSTEPLADTRLELVLDDGTKPPKLDGRAFAVPSTNGELAIYVFDAKAPDPTCTDVNVGGWMEKLGGGSAAVVRVAGLSGAGKRAASSISHVHGGKGGKYALRSAPAKGVTVDVGRYDQVFEAAITGKGASGIVSGIVCATR